MSDTEYERFEITDYDLENEFNPNRQRRKNTKNQQIYGIWASDSDNEEAEDFSRGRKRGAQKLKDYTAPVSFVCGGVQQSGKKEEIQNREKSPISDEEDELRPRFGGIKGGTSSESDGEVEPEITMRSTAGFRKANPNNVTISKGVGQWEQHTRGIGAKLLLQMGYEPGRGLGKDLQGISTPVQAAVRKGRGAIGAYGPEKNASVEGKNIKKQIDEDEKETKEFKEKMHQWRKDAPTKKGKNTRYYYRSVEEIIEKGKKPGYNFPDKLSKKLGNVVVIDMTGPEKRVLSGYHALGQTKVADETLYEHRQTKKCTNFALPELMHNLNLIVDLCEQEIISIDKTQRTAKDREIVLIQEKEKLNRIVDLEKNHINTLEEAMELVERLVAPEEQLALEDAEKIFSKLQADFPAEYKEFGLGDLAPGIIAPMFSYKIKDWIPLEEPTKHVETLKRWKTILGMHQTQTTNVFDPYAALVWSGLIPSFRATTTGWNPRVHQPMAALLDAWAPLLPTWILDTILEQMVLPRLQSCVENWDPLTDTTPIHVWIHPWTGLLGHKMDENIYHIIRLKLGNALKAWIPQDRSARAMLTPWKTVFADGDMQTFLIKHIIPKLQLCLSELIINPLQQDLELWNQVWEWNELISCIMMSQILDKFFFPKWVQTLVIWLNQSPNLDQVSRWYSGWKSLFSDDILMQTNIKEHFRRALELMHRSTGGGVPIITMEAVPVQNAAPPKLMDLQIPPPSMEFKVEFKDLVSQKCSERGIIFAPMPGRREMGKQVYRVGKMFCYIDRSVIMISDGSFSNWAPISLPILLEKSITG